MSELITAHASCWLCKVRDVVATCNWRVERWVPIPIRTIVVGDQIRHLTINRFGIVREIELKPPDYLVVTVQRIHKSGLTERFDQYIWYRNGYVKKHMKVDCGAMVCCVCLRDLDGDRHICADHWASQLAAIA